MGRIVFYDIINGKIISFIYFYKDRDIVISDTQPELVRGVSLQSKFPYFFYYEANILKNLVKIPTL